LLFGLLPIYCTKEDTKLNFNLYELSLGTYARKNISFSKGKGCYLYDLKGEQYLDFASGIAVNSLGHCHEHLVKIIQEQSKKLWHVSNMFVIP
jgi:acetylornithine/N-succinyldiaminopimelate aminotransferase